MKIQIIQLNHNDDYVSVRDKMSWIQTGLILLVWPVECEALKQRLALKLVQLHAGKLGAQLALVAKDAQMRFIAKQLRIPVFDSLRQAQESQWAVSEVETHHIHASLTHPNLEILLRDRPLAGGKLDHLATRIISFGISLFSLVVLGAFILPSAKIRVVPKVESQSITLSLATDTSNKDSNPSINNLPTYSRDIILESDDSIQATGSVNIPDKNAIGELHFMNISDHDVVIPVGLVVSTTGSDPIRFEAALKNDQVVAPEESITLEAKALQPGSTGNLPPDTLVLIVGPLGQDLLVTNPSITSGGTDASVPTPTLDDMQRLRQSLSDKLKQACLAELKQRLPDGDILITPSVKLAEILAENFTPSVGEPGRKLTLSLRARFQSQVVSGEVLQRLVASVLDADLPAGYSPINRTLLINQLTSPAMEVNGNTHWTIRAGREYQADIAYSTATNMVKGSTIEAAIDRLGKTLPLAEPAQISLYPTWWPRLPFIPMRIQVLHADIE